jgi:hypothetical protein
MQKSHGSFHDAPACSTAASVGFSDPKDYVGAPSIRLSNRNYPLDFLHLAGSSADGVAVRHVTDIAVGPDKTVVPQVAHFGCSVVALPAESSIW